MNTNFPMPPKLNWNAQFLVKIAPYCSLID
jgi:hypothetical protein